MTGACIQQCLTEKWTNITTQNVQSANGITINPIQNNSVFIHSVPDCIRRAWWTNPVPDWCVSRDVTAIPSVVMSRLQVMSPTETIQRTPPTGDLKTIPSSTSVCIKYAPLFGCTDRTLPHLATSKMIYITDIKRTVNMLQHSVISHD
jgi:hypothetical protein